MENLVIEVSTEIILAIVGPLIGIGIIIFRYLWKKEQCFTLNKEKIDNLSEKELKSDETHKEFTEKINDNGERISKLEGKVDLMIDHFNIKNTSHN